MQLKYSAALSLRKKKTTAATMPKSHTNGPPRAPARRNIQGRSHRHGLAGKAVAHLEREGYPLVLAVPVYDRQKNRHPAAKAA